MLSSPADWNSRYTQQARWTQDLRGYVFARLSLDRAQRVLEVGSGTGVITSELARLTPAVVHGLDIDAQVLAYAAREASGIQYTRGDAAILPYASGAFDITLCHFLLLWVADPQAAVNEMSRVTRPGGAVLALAEPDYGGRIDYPSELAVLGEWQNASLRRQGANPEIGRRLAGILINAGLTEVEVGILGGQWSKKPSPAEQDIEWEVLRHDLMWLEGDLKLEIERSLDQLRQLDRAAWQQGERILYVPTFYAWGRVP